MVSHPAFRPIPSFWVWAASEPRVEPQAAQGAACVKRTNARDR